MALLALVGSAQAEQPKPLKVMLVTGGCCHDYAKQKDLLKAGLEARAHVVVEQVHTDDKSTKARFPMFEKADWAAGFDAVIHDECSADVTEPKYVENILNAHKNGLPGVNLHCAMHSYRIPSDEWFKYCGIQSSRHGPQKPIDVIFIERDHAITKGLQNWTTVNEELYNNLKLFETAKPLVRGKQDVGNKTDDYIVAWTNQYGKGKVFSTTLGHNNDTVGDARYLDLVARGLLWSCDKLNDQYLKPTK